MNAGFYGPPGIAGDTAQLASHASLQTTRRYAEGDTESKRKWVWLIEGNHGDAVYAYDPTAYTCRSIIGQC
jgi:hypothetical protein